VKVCPFCAEKIQEDAIKCRYCGEWIDKINRDHWKLKDNTSGVTIRERFDTYLSTHQGSLKKVKLEAKNAKELFA
jgi:uncharacterized membrane protein YvbJ